MTADATQLRTAFYAGLPPGLATLLREAAGRGAAAGTPLYLVGGAVRDLLLGRPALDLDLVLAGDAIAFARRVAAPHGFRVTAHPAFGTATVLLPADWAPSPGAVPGLDFVTARRETYPTPGQLPLVTPAGLDADLARRDFTINALALPLDPADPILHDPFDGQGDLAAGRVRALHAASFRDDPTRIFRAVRYAGRFGFQIEPQTAAWIAAALAAGLVARLTPDRVRHELERTLAEPDPAPLLAHLAALGALAAIDPDLAWNPAHGADLTCGATPELRLYLLIGRRPAAVRARIAARLQLAPRPLQDLARLEAAAPTLPGAGPAQAAAVLRPLDPRSLALGRCLLPPPVAAVVARYQDTWQHIRPLLTGDDLRALGLPPGPVYRALLAALRDARLEGGLANRADEQAFVQEWLARTAADTHSTLG